MAYAKKRGKRGGGRGKKGFKKRSKGGGKRLRSYTVSRGGIRL